MYYKTLPMNLNLEQDRTGKTDVSVANILTLLPKEKKINKIKCTVFNVWKSHAVFMLGIFEQKLENNTTVWLIGYSFVFLVQVVYLWRWIIILRVGKAEKITGFFVSFYANYCTTIANGTRGRSVNWKQNRINRKKKCEERGSENQKNADNNKNGMTM